MQLCLGTGQLGTTKIPLTSSLFSSLRSTTENIKTTTLVPIMPAMNKFIPQRKSISTNKKTSNVYSLVGVDCSSTNLNENAYAPQPGQVHSQKVNESLFNVHWTDFIELVLLALFVLTY